MVVIFGMDIDNDQHIIRDVMLNIVICYLKILRLFIVTLPKKIEMYLLSSIWQRFLLGRMLVIESSI